MATINVNNPTLADWATRQDPDGKTGEIVEILNTENPILQSMAFQEGNLPTGHQLTIRSGLPTVAFRQMYKGTAQSKSRTVQVVDNCGILEGWSDIDQDVAELNGDVAAFRKSEDTSFIESMGQMAATNIFYGNSDVDPEKFTGLTLRYSSMSAVNASNIIRGGSSDTDNCSIWLITWAPDTCFGIFPKGSKAGLMHEDLGIETVHDDDGNPYRAYRSHFKWKLGLSLKNWKYVVRIPNIDASALLPGFASGADLQDLMVQAIERLPGTKGRRVFYAPPNVTSMLRRQVRKTSNVNLSLDDHEGRKVLTFDGIPVEKCEALTIAEALVT